ncbi:IS21 family transposase [Patescibacteria group bacterium]|nr:IS21 family transposase [Patescibacteria group bacterium]
MTPIYCRDRQDLEHQLVVMHARGWSIRSLSKHFGLGRNTVRRILRRRQAARDEGPGRSTGRGAKPESVRHSKLDPFLPLMTRLLDKYPGITGVRLYEELREAGYEGGMTILQDRLKRLRPKPKKAPTVRFETEPGVQGQMDWSPYTIRFGKEGRKDVLCFSYILGFSRRQYIDFTLHRDFFTLIRRHENAFGYFGGVPAQCLYDGEKTVILRREAGRPVFNPAFIDFITHYRCRPVACRQGRPETKGKVEAPFKYVEKNLLCAREFDDLEDLRRTARWWLRERSDLHVHDTTGRPPLELFLEREQGALQPLPGHPYDTCEVALRVCSLDGFLEFETNRYSAPLEYVADILTLKAGEREILIYSPEIELLARHERLPRGAGLTVELPEHRQNKKIRYGLEPVRESFLALGQAAQAFLEGLENKIPRYCGFHARYILHLKENYETGDIDAALAHANRYQAYEAKAVERILKAKARPRTLEAVRIEAAQNTLSKALPEIKQRPLDEYCRLLGHEEVEDEK